jgi:hypothetical protein
MRELWKIPAAVGAAVLLTTLLASGQPAKPCCKAPGLTPSGPQAAEPDFRDLPGPGEKCWIGEVSYFVYEFATAPKMGPVILKIELYDKSGTRVSDLEISGRADMPEMRGAHDSGEVGFKLNKKADYLLPVNVVMPGEWEVRLTFSRNKIVLFRGRLTFKV